MAQKNITINDLARILNISRNTVSKAINGKQGVSPKAKKLILDKAKELNYKGFGDSQGQEEQKINGNIVFLTSEISLRGQFWPLVVQGLEKKLSSMGYNFLISIVSINQVENLEIPHQIRFGEICGIVCTELYSEKFVNSLMELQIPLVCIDTYSKMHHSENKFDIILMENIRSIQRLVKFIQNKGIKEIGFVGKRDHCLSFYERFIGYQLGLISDSTVVQPAYIISPEQDSYGVKWLADKLSISPNIPKALICANDDIAIKVINALETINKKVPEDILVTGFDDINEASLFSPSLTTVSIAKNVLGEKAGERILNRIQHPEKPFDVTYIANKIIMRESCPE